MDLRIVSDGLPGCARAFHTGNSLGNKHNSKRTIEMVAPKDRSLYYEAFGVVVLVSQFSVLIFYHLLYQDKRWGIKTFC